MRIHLFCLTFLLLLSCKTETKKKAEETFTYEVEALENPIVRNSSLPRLFSANSKLFLSWIEKNNTMATLNYATYESEKWSAIEAITSGSDWFTNWADFPAIAATPNGNILTSFLQKSAGGTYTYDVKLNLYNAQNKTWKKNFILHKDGTKSEHGFVSIRPYAANSFLVIWLDGRETVGKEHGGGQMTLRGAIVFEDGTIDYDTLLDERICDCCQTGVAIGPNDEIITAYRDRSEDEIRDISVVRWEMNGGWSKPQTIGNDNWKIAGCPVNGPTIDSYGNNVAVAWFTAVDDSPKVQVAFSKDIGRTFGLPIRIDDGNTLGRVDIAMVSDNAAVVSWMENIGDETLIQVMKIESNGSKGIPLTVTKTSSERASGFPQMEQIDGKIYFAWTRVGKNSVSIIETAVVDLSAL